MKNAQGFQEKCFTVILLTYRLVRARQRVLLQGLQLGTLKKEGKKVCTCCTQLCLIILHCFLLMLLIVFCRVNNGFILNISSYIRNVSQSFLATVT